MRRGGALAPPIHYPITPKDPHLEATRRFSVFLMFFHTLAHIGSSVPVPLGMVGTAVSPLFCEWLPSTASQTDSFFLCALSSEPLGFYRVRGRAWLCSLALPLCVVAALAPGSGSARLRRLGLSCCCLSSVKRSLGKGVASAKPVGTHVGSSAWRIRF